MRINWLKIFANMGVTFCSVLVGVVTVESLTAVKTCSTGTLVFAAVVAGLIQAALTFFKELSKEASDDDRSPRSRFGGGTGGDGHASTYRRRGGPHRVAYTVLSAMVFF